MTTWGIVSQKGGVGKTTTAINLASGLAARGERTLLVDCDPQGNATTGLGVDKRKLDLTLLEVLTEAAEGPTEATVRRAITKVDGNLDLLGATLDLAAAESNLSQAVGKELLLREALDTVRDQYDWIILDGPPSLGLLTINILSASDKILVPMQCEFFAMEGLAQLMKTVELVRKRINPSLEIARILFTMVDTRSRLTNQVQDEVRQFFGEKVSANPIPRNVRLSEASSFGQAAIVQFPASKGALAYAGLVEELQACVGL